MSTIKARHLRNYTTLTGKIPFVEWLNKVRDPTIRQRIRRRLDRLELGHYGDCKSLGTGLFELRLSFGPGYRIYYAEMDGFTIVLLSGGDKSSQKKDIKQARQYWQELQERPYG